MTTIYNFFSNLYKNHVSYEFVLQKQYNGIHFLETFLEVGELKDLLSFEKNIFRISLLLHVDFESEVRKPQSATP